MQTFVARAFGPNHKCPEKIEDCCFAEDHINDAWKIEQLVSEKRILLKERRMDTKVKFFVARIINLLSRGYDSLQAFLHRMQRFKERIRGCIIPR